MWPAMLTENIVLALFIFLISHFVNVFQTNTMIIKKDRVKNQALHNGLYFQFNVVLIG